jgi:hypothetical protein
LLAAAEHASTIATDGTGVYWADGSDVLAVPVGGGAVTTVASQQSAARSIAVDAANVYWVNGVSTVSDTDGSITSDTNVVRAPKGGGQAVTLATGLTFVDSLAMDSLYVYWVETGTLAVPLNVVMRAPIAGGVTTTIATGSGSNCPCPGTVAVDATSVYWGQYGAVMKAPLAGGPPVTLASNVGAASLELDATNVYILDFTAVHSVPKDGGPVSMLVSGTSNNYAQFLSDATNVYWLAWASGGEGIYGVSKN